jgi:hypothetical protein
MMEIFIPVILVVKAFLVQLSMLGPSVLLILSKMTHFFGSFVNLPLQPSSSGFGPLEEKGSLGSYPAAAERQPLSLKLSLAA